MTEYYSYMGNNRLKKPNAQITYEPWQIAEIQKCMEDPIYFIKNYVKIVHVDKGLINFQLYDYQERFVEALHNNRFVIAKFPRQTGKSTTTAAYFLHYILFNDQKTIFILANKAATAREILSRVQKAYENLPMWLQQGIISWNKGSIELENGSKVVAAATSSSAIRGQSANMVLMDETAFIPQNQFDEFFESTYPTISSGSETKLFMISTPKGMNHFYRYWEEAIQKRSEFFPIEINWNDVPGRDEEFRRKTIANVGEETWLQEYEAAFMGSSNTLISGMYLKTMTFSEPILTKGKLKIFERPVVSDHHQDEDHIYVVTVDCSEGVGADYSVISVIDVTNYPFKQVAVFRDNLVSPLHLPDIITALAKEYNNAWLLVEINSAGKQVADTIRFEHEYDNVLMCSKNESRRQQLMYGPGTEMIPGLRTTKSTKRIGCSNIKHLIENGKLIIRDFETIREFSTFVRNKDSFAAEEGSHDDIVMSLVIFGWLSGQEFFKELTNKDIRKHLYAKMAERFSEELPMDILSTLDSHKSTVYIDNNGIAWS